MTAKMLKCVRPNGEELIIPKLEKQAFKSNGSREHLVAKEGPNGSIVWESYAEEVRPQTTMIITDEIPQMRCMSCRGVHSSKSAFRNCYKAHGYIEVGNESLEIQPDDHDAEALDKQLEDDITYAFNALKNDEMEMDELTRARCKIMDKQIADSGDNRLRSHDGALLEGESDG